MSLLHRVMPRARACAWPVMAVAASTVAAQDGSSAGLRPVEDPLFGRLLGRAAGLAGPWAAATYARGTPPEDMALIAIQSAQATPDQLWPAPAAAVRASTQVPEVDRDHGGRALRLDALPVQRDRWASRRSPWSWRWRRTDGPRTSSCSSRTPRSSPSCANRCSSPAVEAFAVLAPEPTPDPATLGYARRGGELSGRQPGRGAGRHADRATGPRAASGGRPHERQRRPGSRRVACGP